MPGELVPIIIVPSMLYFLYLTLKIVFDSFTKRSLIKQGIASKEVCDLMLVNSEMSPHISLRRGIVLVAVGLPVLLNNWLGLDDLTLVGAALITGGIGFIIYYVITKNRLNTL